MLLVVTPEDDIPGWLYPEAFPEVPRRAECWIKTPSLGESDFAALWRAVDPAAANNESLESQYAHCDTGVPHNAPDYLPRIKSDLVAKLADLPDSERWRVAQAWAAGRLGKRPNQAELASHKELVKALCGLARRAVECKQPLILLPIKH